MKRREFIKTLMLFTSMITLTGCKKIPLKEKSLKHIEIHLVEHCNLNCKYCSHFSCIAEKEIYDLLEYEKDVKQLAKVTNSNVDVIQLLGGEPLLHPEITNIFKITRKNFPNSAIDLITNGILLDEKDENFYRTMRDYNIRLVPSIYPIKINWKSVLNKTEKYNVTIIHEENNEKLTMDSIKKHTVKYFAKMNIDLKGTQNKNRPCEIREYCANFIHGKLYPCFVVSNIKHFNKKFNKNIPVTNKDYIDIYEAKNTDELIEFLKTPVPFCRYCKGYEGGGKWESIVNHSIDEWAM